MQINLSGHHLDITDALRDYVDEKFAKLERHSDQITSVQVILSPEPKSHKAESTIHISGADLFATAQADDMYAAIDALTSKLDRQILKHKEKTVGRKHGH
ncbi:MAG: ribosome-associated translation inhibitor RaiA [Alcanivorax sp.]|uniref:Ribosome hibernation promoting factor n=2 Tax=Alloalcanivorax TaxID=3020832 RepID=A0A9Q3UJ99_9GAMM|nr:MULTISPECIES: ribosome-associated translation inhibitor RaiA [Alloalcanivorax]MCH2557324.1 ribosome-associated translation inhibitor RaiA [Alcanivorax sp.]MBM7332419.1 ribosome-associated translation inhibitor RaiA [Alloalcanivorax marinus]MCC4308211.1 ribosome-associated translation inhibitor RaiA [Alloalcanivorax marinus]MCU5787391.1 sigma 54 modulation protein/ribosomal protein S30EA [Alloalcanivorax marinus]TMW10565.1 ribosome-associated translation inhibitor RaiA [Alloalcanivorax gelat|tara:strand:- start:2576 stop:2875 length:300 start_codon:yes stop_codon:yes gene_type:complete